MPTSLTFAEHLEALDANGKRLADLATTAGMSAPVPTCPAWNTEALVAHVAMVHRWARAVASTFWATGKPDIAFAGAENSRYAASRFAAR